MTGPSRNTLIRRRSVVLSVVGVLVAMGSSTALAAPATVVVSPGQSIQAAIDGAQPGATINVRAGTYHENLEIIKDHLTLRGAGLGRTVLLLPDYPLQRYCTPDPNDPFVVGICATGDLDPSTGTVSRFLEGVTISGFSVRDFPSAGIILVGVRNGVVSDNETSGNEARAIFALSSTRTRIIGNDATDNFMSGIGLDEFPLDPTTLPPANATVVGNRSHDNRGDGTLVLNFDHGTIAGNVTTERRSLPRVRSAGAESVSAQGLTPTVGRRAFAVYEGLTARGYRSGTTRAHAGIVPVVPSHQSPARRVTRRAIRMCGRRSARTTNRAGDPNRLLRALGPQSCAHVESVRWTLLDCLHSDQPCQPLGHVP